MTHETRFSPNRESLVDSGLLFLLAVFYARNLHPFLWWGDGPELLTAAVRGGIAHPSGYPLYLALLDLFCSIPLGSIAWRGALFSTVCTLSAAALLLRIPRSLNLAPSAFLGWKLGVVLLFLSSPIQDISVITEVYALTLVFLSLLIVCGIRLHRSPTPGNLLLVALIAGLAVGHHRIVALALAGYLLALLPAITKVRNPVGSLCGALLAGLSGLLLPYCLIWFRAQSNPPLSWENPSDLVGLWKLFSAHQFRIDQKVQLAREWLAYENGLGPNPWTLTWKMVAAFPATVWSALGLALIPAVAALGILWKEQPRVLIGGFVAVMLPVVFVAQYHVGDQSTFLVVPLFIFATLCCLGWGYLSARASSFGPWGTATLLVLGFAAAIQMRYGIETPSSDLLHLPERIARRTLDAAPAGSVVIAVPKQSGQPVDYTYYPLLYQHEVAFRGDKVSLISDGYFSSPWYRGTFEHENLPTRLFDALEKGTARVPLIHVADLGTFLRETIPSVQERSRASGPVKEIYHVSERYFFANGATLGELLAENLLPDILHRPLLVTGGFPELDPHLPEGMAWEELLHVPVRTEGYRPLDGMPIPTGKLFRLSESPPGELP